MAGRGTDSRGRSSRKDKKISKNPYYEWFTRVGKKVFLVKYHEYFDCSEEHKEKITQIWQNLDPNEKKKYYDLCGKTWSPTGQQSSSSPTKPLVANNFAPKKIAHDESTSPPLNLRQPGPAQQSAPVTASMYPVPIGITHPNVADDDFIEQIRDQQYQKYFDIFRYKRLDITQKSLNACLNTKFQFLSIIRSCSIVNDSNTLYSYPLEIGIITFSFEMGVLNRDTIRVHISPIQFSRISPSLKSELQREIEDNAGENGLDPRRGYDMKTAWHLYNDIIDPLAFILYNEQDIKLVESTLRALAFPRALSRDSLKNFMSIQALSMIINELASMEVSRSRESNRMDPNLLRLFLEKDHSRFNFDNVCEDHDLISVHIPSIKSYCPLSQAALKIHLLFECMFQYNFLGIQMFYKDETHSLCASRVAPYEETLAEQTTSTISEYLEQANLADVTNQIEEINLQKNEPAFISSQKCIFKKSYGSEGYNESDRHQALLDIFGGSGKQWIVLPEVAFRNIPCTIDTADNS